MCPELFLPDIVGKGFERFWHDQSRYRVLKGGRGSKKSKTTALNLIVRLMDFKDANLLCVRQTANTLLDSVFSDLLWAIDKLCVSPFWSVTKSPPRMKYLPFNNEILFRGLDDPLKLTSISVPQGVLCWIWLEEAYEVPNRAAFDKLDLTLRGVVPLGLFKQITLTFNPWLKSSWLYPFCNETEDMFLQTTSYLCNEFLDSADFRLFERMKRDQPDRYRIEGLGEWGSPGGAVFKNLSDDSFDEDAFDNFREGLDWGFAADPLAWVRCHFDYHRNTLFIVDELYQTGLSNRDTIRLLRDRSKDIIIADSAEPKSIAELRANGFRIRSARKGPGSVASGLRWLQGLDKILIHPRCIHARRELSSLCFATDKCNAPLPRVVGDDHLVDALRYALEWDVGRSARKKSSAINLSSNR